MTVPLRTETPAPPTAAAQVASAAPRWGVLLAILLLLPPHTLWLVRVETELGVFGANMTDVSLFYTPVTALFLCGFWNRWISRRRAGWVLRPAELAALYVGLTLSAAFCGSDLLQNLTPVLVHPFWFASETNHWASLFHRYIPEWFAPRDHAALTGYYIGESDFLQPDHLRAWLTPLVTWGTFLLVLAMMMLCITVLVRRQWTERERLSYPVIQLPMELARPDGFARLVGSRLFQIGAGVTIAVEVMNCFHAFYPSVPHMSLGLVNVGQIFVEPPWNALATWPPLFLGWMPFAVGISFFLPLDLAFSSWVFYLIRRAEDVLAVAWGWRDPGASVGQMRFPFVREQASGAWIALFLLTFWIGRAGYRQVIRAAITGRGDPDAVSYRWAIAGLVLGAGCLLAFSVAAGMALPVAIAYFAIYWMLMVTMTRIRAQLGPPMLELFFVNPEQMLVAFTGTRALSPSSLTVLSYFFWFNRCYRCQPMAHTLEAFRLADATGLSARTLARWIAIVVTVGVAAGLCAVMFLYYDAGETSAKILTYRTGVGRETFNRLEDWLRNPRGPDHVGMSRMAGGAGFTLFLSSMQSRFLWWPLHPIGYAFSTCFAMEYWWSTIATTWLIKLLLVRYGGLQAYVRARPLFLGLILGDALVAVGLALLSWLFGWHGVSRL